MEDEYRDNCLSIEANDDTYKEKTRIAEVAAATLCRLNSIMRQMKDWRDDRVKLRSNIWRLKLALRVAGRETDDTLQADPLIEHQRAEIKRLEGTNRGLKKELADIKTSLLDTSHVSQGAAWKTDDKLVRVKRDYLVETERLNNEIQYLKIRLNEAQEGHEHNSEAEHLKCKLKHFMMVDHTMEIIFTDIVNKVAETIANLSEELVNTHERFHKSQMRNDNLYVEIDKLKAMLRFKAGNITDYQKRVTELDNLTKRLKTELNRFKDNHGDNAWSNDSNYQQNFRIVERLTQDLGNKLQNDHQAFLAAGDPDCLKYMQKIVELRVTLRQLHVELRKFKNDLRPESPGKTVEYKNYSKQLSILDSALKEINIEIDKLKNDHVRRHCRIGGADGLEYLNKIEELEKIVEKARTTMNGLSRRTEGGSNEWKNIEKLEGLVGGLCHEIKQLEMIVASSDCSGVFERIEQMEELIVRLRTESKGKNERVDDLNRELYDMENLLGQRVQDLNDSRRKVAALTEENRVLKGTAKKFERRTSELEREQEDSKNVLEQLQQVQREASITRRKLQNLQIDRDGLSKEVGKIRDVLQKRNEEIKVILADKETTEKALNAKIMDLMRNLQAAYKENEKLQVKINEFERSKCKELAGAAAEKAKYSRDRSSSVAKELAQLKTNLLTSMEGLENANGEIADLKAKLEHSAAEKARLETCILQLETKKEELVYHLGAEKTACEERLKEIAQLKTDFNDLGVKKAILKTEKEQLATEVTCLRFDRDLLQKSVDHHRSKCSMLQEEIDKYQFDCENLRNENRKLQNDEENLNSKLREARTELNGAGDKIRRLEVENSRLHDDLKGLTLKNAGHEGQVQLLLSKKNELETRIFQLDNENGLLKDRLNDVKAASECSTVELNKLRTDHDKTISESMGLRMALDAEKKGNEELKEANEELKLKLNEIQTEFKVLDNQLKLLETTNATIKTDKKAAEDQHLSNISKLGQDQSVMCDESMVRELNKQKTATEFEESEQGEYGKRASDETKTMEMKEEVKKLMTEKESLRLEMQELRSQCFEAKKELSRTKEELQKRNKELFENSVKPVPSDHDVVDLYCKEIKHHPSRSSNHIDAVSLIDQSSVRPNDGSTTGQEAGIEIERLFEIMSSLKVENVALKMVVNSLRCNGSVNFTKDEEWMRRIQYTMEEIEALKVELAKLRDEKESLRVQLDTGRTKLNRLESEKTALKDELYMLRKSNADLKHKVNELRCNYQKWKERSAGFEECVMKTIKKIKKHTMSAESHDAADDDLKALLKKYISNEEILQGIEQEMNTEWT